MPRSVVIPIFSCVIALACADEPPSGFTPFASGDDAEPDGPDGPDRPEHGDELGQDEQGNDDSHGEDDGDSDSDGDGDGDPIKFDVAADPIELEQTPCGVDILFIIDNSGSMSQHKPGIIAAFDNFIDEMVGVLEPNTPVHIGVTRATGFFDPGNGSGWSNETCEFTFLNGIWNPPTQANNGINGQQGRLYQQGDQRYFEFIVGEDSMELGGWFKDALAGAIANEEASNSESVVAAAAYPFHPINADYNAGFLREKAVLVLFLLSDAPDATPPEIPTSEFIELVSDAKAGCGDGCVLPTGVVQGHCYADPELEPNPELTNVRLYDFMNGFGSPPVALDLFANNIAPASFSSVLGATLAESIAYTCESIVPEG